MTSPLPHTPIPLVIVEGFLGGTSTILWGKFHRFLNLGAEKHEYRRIIHTSVGPVSSLHDRACELYYALMGGSVDYGEDHAKLNKHSRYGRVNKEGIYPQWSRLRPLHFLGHSIGGATIIKLQALLERGHFGPHCHPDMILSVSTISSPFRGTQLVYILGESENAAPAVRPLSAGSLLAKLVHLVAFFSPLLPQVFNFHAEARALSFYDISLVSLLKQVRKSDWAESRDATPYDMTFEAADERESNLEGQPHRRTYYQSHVTSMNSGARAVRASYLPAWTLLSILSHPFRLLSCAISAFDCSALQPVPSFLVDQGTLGEAFKDNDGIVPLFSQWHPLPCRLTKCQHIEVTKHISNTAKGPMLPLVPGTWNVYHIDAATHISLVPYWTGNPLQKHYWTSLGCWLRAIDDHGDTQQQLLKQIDEI